MPEKRPIDRETVILRKYKEPVIKELERLRDARLLRQTCMEKLNNMAPARLTEIITGERELTYYYLGRLIQGGVVDLNKILAGRKLESLPKEDRLLLTKLTLTDEFVMKAARDFDLWLEPAQTLCERGSRLRVSDVMHTPEKVEYIKETATLDKALHLYVMGIHQPLIVKNEDGKVTGVLRFGLSSFPTSIA